ncbi:hypothetical protein ACFVAJ_18650 [Agromyces sp. NPDC057679]|uniref:hypothetical protein n=1 Tax=Agromyces sp. NPDC057679 TaxID=3346207 RepID=UPI00366B8F25
MTSIATVTHIRANRAPLSRVRLLARIVDRYDQSGDPVEFDTSGAGDERRILGTLLNDGFVDFAGAGNAVIPTDAGRSAVQAFAA